MFHSIRVPSQAIRGPQWKPDRGLDLANTDHSHWREQAASRGPPGAFRVSGDGPPPTGRLRHVKFRKQEAGTGRSRSRADKRPGDRSSWPFPGARSGPRGPKRRPDVRRPPSPANFHCHPDTALPRWAGARAGGKRVPRCRKQTSNRHAVCQMPPHSTPSRTRGPRTPVVAVTRGHPRPTAAPKNMTANSGKQRSGSFTSRVILSSGACVRVARPERRPEASGVTGWQQRLAVTVLSYRWLLSLASLCARWVI